MKPGVPASIFRLVVTGIVLMGVFLSAPRESGAGASDDELPCIIAHIIDPASESPVDNCPEMIVRVGSFLRSNGRDKSFAGYLCDHPDELDQFWGLDGRSLSHQDIHKLWFSRHDASPVDLALRLLLDDIDDQQTLEAFSLILKTADGGYAEYVADAVFGIFMDRPAFFARNYKYFSSEAEWIRLSLPFVPHERREELKRLYSQSDSRHKEEILQLFE